MKAIKNEIYSLVDEDFLSKFERHHQQFMKNFYYNYYKNYCIYINRNYLSKDAFFTNMHRRRYQLYQLCCPYCGSIVTTIRDKRIEGTGGYNYCFHCGKGSVIENVAKSLVRFINQRNVNELGLKALKKEHPDTETWILAYNSNVYHSEIIQMATIIEVVFRDFFESLLYIENLDSNNNYVRKAIKTKIKNDFMNIDKANKEFKKAFDINLKNEIETQDWEMLVDIVNLRNMIVHNNARVDEIFKQTPTYTRLINIIDSDFVKLDEEHISKYFTSVTIAVMTISHFFIERYFASRNKVIANYYFNNPKMFEKQ